MTSVDLFARRGRKQVVLLLLLPTFTLAGCSTSSVTAGSGPPVAIVSPQPPSTGHSGQPAPVNGTIFDKAVPASVENLPLVDQHGRVVSLASLRGHTVVLADFLTLCQEICPLTSANLHRVVEHIAAAGQTSTIAVVEATVDPARDTPARLAAYQALYGAAANWELLTGTPQQVATLWQTLGVSYQKVPEDPGPPPIDWWTGQPLHYDVNHQDVVFVIAPNGHEVWVTDGTPNTQGTKPPSKLLIFMSDTGHSNLAHPANPSWTASDVEAALSYFVGSKI